MRADSPYFLEQAAGLRERATNLVARCEEAERWIDADRNRAAGE
jgi:hypothetical protein